MNIFFDVDYTIIAVDNSLRPGVRKIMETLATEGHAIYVWSGNGIRWLELRKHCLDTLVTDCFEKPMSNYRSTIHQNKMPILPNLVIDDHLEIVAALGGVWVRPYYFANSADNEMEEVYRIVKEWLSTGHSQSPRFRPPPCC